MIYVGFLASTVMSAGGGSLGRGSVEGLYEACRVAWGCVYTSYVRPKIPLGRP